jgi:regulatory protein
MENRAQRLTPLQAWEVMKHWCAWSERCHYDCAQKLRQHGLNAAETDTLLARLVEENYLNEERYAVQFAGGHFRLKKWGRRKIEMALRQKQVSDYCIRKAMAQLEDEPYQQNLQKLAATKWKAAAAKTPAQRWFAVKRHLLQKGYTPREVLQTLQSLQSGSLD